MVQRLSDDELRDKALEFLTQHLGPASTIRFLSWLRNAPRDYQAWRTSKFQDVSLDQLLEQMREVERRQGA